MISYTIEQTNEELWVSTSITKIKHFENTPNGGCNRFEIISAKMVDANDLVNIKRTTDITTA